ncbi:MAG: hypothetical protein LLF80_08935 [Porphyromonadaceae bacterium]|nr:hypothetical protein [Porphyromonadaceae bacterium]
MKKTILLFGMISMTLLLTSCLEEGSRNYEETSVAYIAEDYATGNVYGRTLSGRFITSSQMQLMFPGTLQLFQYSWTEERGTTPVRVGASSTEVVNADNVIISSEPVTVSSVSLHIDQQPPVVETPAKFVAIDPPFYAGDDLYLGDNWIFQYAYEAKKGESAVVNFYYTEDPAATDNEITIVMDLTIGGTPEGTTVSTKSDLIALNMSDLRAMYEGTSTTNTKELKINFKYYVKGNNQIVESPVYRMTVRGN